MLSKNEYFHMKVKLQKRELAISEFELKDPLYTQFIELRNAGHDEYVRRTKIWNKYYQDVQSSPIGLLLKEMSQITNRDLGRETSKETKEKIKEIIDKSEEAMKETNRHLEKPAFEDPLYISYKISTYIRSLAEVKEMKLIMTEYKDVYEKSKETADFSI